jgi:hypothetical protein
MSVAMFVHPLPKTSILLHRLTLLHAMHDGPFRTKCVLRYSAQISVLIRIQYNFVIFIARQP